MAPIISIKSYIIRQRMCASLSSDGRQNIHLLHPLGFCGVSQKPGTMFMLQLTTPIPYLATPTTYLLYGVSETMEVVLD